MNKTHEELVELLYETLVDECGAGSDVSVGDRFGCWIPVSGNLDLEHLASDILAWSEEPEGLSAEELEALPVGSIVKAHWVDGSQPDYTAIRGEVSGNASFGGTGILGGKYWSGMYGWGAVLTVAAVAV